MIGKQRLAIVLIAFGLGLTSLPAAGWAAPISLESGARASRFVPAAPAWSDTSPGDLGVTLVDLFAFAADTLTYYQDVVGSEAYLPTACDTPC